MDRPSQAAYDLAAQHHPHWYALKRGARALHARNAHQILGRRLNERAAFVACWTPDGSLDGEGPDTGGTGQALRMAATYGITVLNLQREDHLHRAEHYAGAGPCCRSCPI